MILAKRLNAAVFVPLALMAQTRGIGRMWYRSKIRKNGSCEQGAVYRAVVAQTPEQQAIGLSGRRQPLASNEAMIFVWNQRSSQTLWMKNTYIPLTLIFFGTDSELLSCVEMSVEPDPTQPLWTYSEEDPVMAAIESFGGIVRASLANSELCVQTP